MRNHTLEAIPTKAQFRPGESIAVQVRLCGEPVHEEVCYRWVVYEEHRLIREGAGRLQRRNDLESEALIELSPISEGSGAYGLFVMLTMDNGSVVRAETAFDVAEHWREAPRYGFLTDFEPEEAGQLEDVTFMNRHHINLVQFYDWMYRHDRLLADEDIFVDPLGRSISFAVVKEKILALREHGIASMAYAAVYGSLPDYAENHPDQLLYQNDGEPYSLGKYFYIMDISERSDWTKHIIDQFVKAVEGMGFDGLQLDQYGFPKKAIRRKGEHTDVVALKELYPRFIDLVREAVTKQFGEDQVGVVFNNVSHYPTHTTATSSQDVMYIEVWDPAYRFCDLKRIIDEARKWSGKQVVLAAYLPAFHPDHPSESEHAEIGAIFTLATIFASGGYQILLGEHNKLLADSYFPKYGTMSDRFKVTMTKYYNFIVMYRNLLYDLALDDVSMAYSCGINTEVVFAKEGVTCSPHGEQGTIWTIIKEKPGYLIVHLINLVELSHNCWHQAQTQLPSLVSDVEIKVEYWEEIESVFWATPDEDTIKPTRLNYEVVPKEEGCGMYAQFTLPHVSCWTMVVMKLKQGVPAATFYSNVNSVLSDEK
ncbi:glycoside hydrolase family 66 protein [Cohnella sp. WQ 127256]|uniref:glycoside hydrolase family 66 protein n=1 Tax=Cohnella sp. WQ 127256 TaxID=2938790 RepID=UPI002117A4AF